MQKTNKNVKEKVIIGIACAIAVAVFLLSLHSKDLVKYGRSIERPELKDVSAKAVAELHDHVEKKVVKSFSNSINDGQLQLSRRLGEAEVFADEDPGLWGRFSEQLFLWGVYITMPFSRLV
ncbi:MAG TPA: hypothetical protein PKD68_02875 [Candidatus Saccharibacteria bacterium]|nr:hypothetical protein [Candidatus Saccharibacteria bacterium]